MQNSEHELFFRTFEKIVLKNPNNPLPPRYLELIKEKVNVLKLVFQGLESIPCKEIGYILRTLGQNPTEDEIIALVCEAGCEW